MSLRPATEQDLARIIPWIASAEDCLLWAGPKVKFPMTVASLSAEIAFTDDNSFALTTGDDPIAFGQLLRRDNGLQHLARILVDPARRGDGSGRRLCQGLIEVAATRGTRGVSLFVYSDNHRARRLYAGLGFETIAGQSSETVLFMLKRLDQPQPVSAGA